MTQQSKFFICKNHFQLQEQMLNNAVITSSSMEIASVCFTSVQMWFMMVLFLFFNSFALFDLLIEIDYLFILSKFFSSRLYHIFVFFFSCISKFLQSFLQGILVLSYSHKPKFLFPLFQGFRLLHQAWSSEFLQSFLFNLSQYSNYLLPFLFRSVFFSTKFLSSLLQDILRASCTRRLQLNFFRFQVLNLRNWSSLLSFWLLCLWRRSRLDYIFSLNFWFFFFRLRFSLLSGRQWFLFFGCSSICSFFRRFISFLFGRHRINQIKYKQESQLYLQT